MRHNYSKTDDYCTYTSLEASAGPTTREEEKI